MRRLPIVGGSRNGEVVVLHDQAHAYVQVETRHDSLDVIFTEVRLYVRRYWLKFDDRAAQLVSVLLHPSVAEDDLSAVLDAVMIARENGWRPSLTEHLFP